MIDEANSIACARLVSMYLSSPAECSIWTVEDACVTKRVIGNRYGVPADAITCRYMIEHPNQKWSFTIRAVWRNGTLMTPVAIHSVIEAFYDDSGADDDAAAKLAVSDWLRSLPL